MAPQIGRQTAKKVSIKDIVQNPYIKEEGWQPNVIRTQDGDVARASVLGIIISKSDESNYVLDDGTGTIQIRAFDESNVVMDKNIGIGTSVHVIGRPREFNNQKYIVPEIVKQIDPGWLKLRTLELQSGIPSQRPKEMNNEQPQVREETISIQEKAEQSSQDMQEEVVQASASENPYDKIMGIINELDQGSGAGIDDVVLKSGMNNCEDMINSLMEEGEIFEISPGRVKVL